MVFFLREDDVGLGESKPAWASTIAVSTSRVVQLQSRLGLDLVRLCRLQSAFGDFDLNGDLVLDAREIGLLPSQFRLGAFDLAPSHREFVAIGNRVDLRQYLALLDVVVFVDQKTYDATRDSLGCDIDDVRLDKGIVSNGMGRTVSDPAEAAEDKHDCY